MSAESNFALAVPAEFVEAVARRVAELLALQAGVSADPWLGVEEAAAHISAPTSRVYDLKARGELEFRKDGSRLLFRRSWLDAYLERGR